MKMISKLTALAVLLSASAALANWQPSSWTFGSNNDGDGGFTQSANGNIWTLAADSMKISNTNNGTVNSSFLKSIAIEAGIGYTISANIKIDSLYADDNNRIGLYMFGDSPVPADQNEVGAIGMMWNYDSPAGGTTPDDEIYTITGLDATAISGTASRNTAFYDIPTEMIGTVVTLEADFYILGTNMTVRGRLIDDQGNITQTTLDTVVAADFVSATNYFGIVGRNRARNYPNLADDRGAPQEFSYESFAIVPEPATVGLFGLGALGAWIVRRNKMKALEQEEEI